MDSFLTLVVVLVIAGLSNWLQRRARSRQESAPQSEEMPPPVPPMDPRRVPPRPTSAPTPEPLLETSLERELRRLLGGEPAAPPARPRSVVAPPPPPIQAPIPPRVGVPTAVPSLPRHLPTTTQSMAPTSVSIPSFSQAQERSRSIGRVRPAAPKTEKRARSYDVQPSKDSRSKHSAMAMITAVSHDPMAARQAFVASLIFGVPKALESRD